MTELEQKLRERTDVDNLMVVKIHSLEEGNATRDKIDELSKGLMVELSNLKDITNEVSEAYTNVRYDLKKARYNVYNQTEHFVRLKLATS